MTILIPKLKLRRFIGTKAFERVGIANTQLSFQTDIPLNTFKDPYILDFLNLKDGYWENDLERNKTLMIN
jgi:predicted nuclease of restriction endonuclease-like (RecB) superfamily